MAHYLRDSEQSLLILTKIVIYFYLISVVRIPWKGTLQQSGIMVLELGQKFQNELWVRRWIEFVT